MASPTQTDEDDGLEPVPEGTLRPERRRGVAERWQLSRRWFMANTVVAGLAAGLPAACRPDVVDPDILVFGQPHAHTWLPEEPFHTPPPEHGGAVDSLEPFVDALPIPPRAAVTFDGDGARLTVRMVTTQVQLHSRLPASTMWTYEGSFPGPTIEVRRGVPLQVTWLNELTGPIPVQAVELSDNTGGDREFDLPGKRGATALPEITALPPWAVVHLHGAITGGGNDGWPENAVGPGRRQLAYYENDQPACALWYHDHAMHVSRMTTMAGLTAGMYVIRDDEEDALGLPSGEREIPLIVCDRNLDTDPTDRLTGQLLHKITVYAQQAEKIPRSFSGPFNVVNGKIWPYLDVEPGRYRFRLLNASSIRPYHLELRTPDGEPAPAGTIVQIGTDAGLLPAPVPIAGPLIIAPAERADLIIDFDAFAGSSLRLIDTSYMKAKSGDVMQFRVRASAPEAAPPLPAVTSPSFRSVVAGSVSPLRDRFVLVTPAFPAVAQMWEMEPAQEPSGRMPIDGIVQFEDAAGEVRTYRRVGKDFVDPVAFTAETSSWERWTYLSLEGFGAPHPMHTHAFTFQALERSHYDVTNWRYLRRADGSIGGGTIEPIKRKGPGEIPANERGWKDVIKLGSGEMVSVIGQYGPAAGRFLHHCHIYEHEDHKMMRPLVLLPPEVIRGDPHGDH
ncbi:multicopper oxidase family protein [Pseudonocardia sp. TRM90224]|uniref:multicopper oxidase family protein n=1 Tax=Pseudonocardia sp. TRM90224 TaxID=2812678 RepID=UPI001E3A0358|nr:multicopper oxidase domain-containing protein [Pseudonocardia sp. TRM90224]